MTLQINSTLKKFSYALFSRAQGEKKEKKEKFKSQPDAEIKAWQNNLKLPTYRSLSFMKNKHKNAKIIVN